MTRLKAALALLLLAAPAAAQTTSSYTLGARIVRTTDPNCTRLGQFYFNSSTLKPRVCTAIGTPGTWQDMAAATGAGSGDVTGPASSVAGNAASFLGTTGKVIQDSGKALPSGSIVGTSDAQALTNKTLSAASNTFTGIGFGEVDADVITAQTAEATADNADTILIYDSSATALRKMTRANFLAGVGGGSPGGSDTQLQRNNAGAFGGISGATSDGVNVTFGSGNLRATRPRVTTSIDDANGAEALKVAATASAVNELTVTNAAAGSAPELSATGDDANIDLKLTPKGSGSVLVSASGTSEIAVGDSDNSHYLGIRAGSNLTADRALIVTTGDASRSVTIDGDGTLVRADGTHTLTNKTLDAEGTGNVITTVETVEFQAAGMNGASAGTMLDLPASNAPAPGVIDGANADYAALDFDAGTDESAQGSLLLPDDWAGSIDFVFDWQAAAVTGDVVWGLQTSCVAADESQDPAFNAAQTATDTAAASANRRNTAAISPVTTTGCAAGERLLFKIFRDADNVADTMSGDARLRAVRFKLRRNQ